VVGALAPRTRLQVTVRAYDQLGRLGPPTRATRRIPADRVTGSAGASDADVQLDRDAAVHGAGRGGELAGEPSVHM
jgi:hypothetical protein